MENEIDISGLDKAELLAALFNGSAQFGMGCMHGSGRADITVDDARKIIDPDSADDKTLTPWEQQDAKRLYFDYLRGRVLKVKLSGDNMRTALYNRDIGRGAAEKIVAQLRASKSVAA